MKIHVKYPEYLDYTFFPDDSDLDLDKKKKLTKKHSNKETLLLVNVSMICVTCLKLLICFLFS